MLADLINSAGLLCDIIGATLLVFYGLPAEINRDGHSFLVLQATDQSMKRRFILFESRSRLAMGLIGIGFTLQLAAVWVG